MHLSPKITTNCIDKAYQKVKSNYVNLLIFSRFPDEGRILECLLVGGTEASDHRLVASGLSAASSFVSFQAKCWRVSLSKYCHIFFKAGTGLQGGYLAVWRKTSA